MSNLCRASHCFSARWNRHLVRLVLSRLPTDHIRCHQHTNSGRSSVVVCKIVKHLQRQKLRNILVLQVLDSFPQDSPISEAEKERWEYRSALVLGGISYFA